MRRKALLPALALAALCVSAVSSSAALAAPLCEVVRSGAPHVVYNSLEQAVGAASGSEETLTVRGVCKGDTTITTKANPLRINGSVDDAQLNGEKKEGPLLTVDPGVTLSITGITITEGNAEAGGGIYSEDSALTLTNCWVTKNEAEVGGGIFNIYGPLTLNGTHVDSNTAEFGGGISSDKAAVTLNDSVVTSNKAQERGGGIESFETTLTLNDSGVDDNTARLGGGLADAFASAFLYDSSVAGNKAEYGGGVKNEHDSTLTLNSTSKIVENKAAGGKDHGGGIYNEKGSTLNLDGGTVNKNTPENIFEEP